MIGRRDALRALVGASLAACGGTPSPPKPSAPPEVPLPLTPLADLVAAAGVEWVLALEPRALAPLLPHLYKLVPEARFQLFSARHGGVDLRALDEIVIASYAQSTLALARGALDPQKVEAAFAARAVRLEPRAVERPAGPDTPIVRLAGEVGATREQLALYGHQGAGLEVGGDGKHLRVAGLFLEGRLKRASPVFRSPPLDVAHQELGPAPARIFFPGPFTGDASQGLAGLLKAATAVGVAATPTAAGTLAVRVVVIGVQGNDVSAAEQRLAATYDTTAAAGIGRLCGLDRPKKPPTVSHTELALTLEVELAPGPIATGLHDATEATLPEMLRL